MMTTRIRLAGLVGWVLLALGTGCAGRGPGHGGHEAGSNDGGEADGGPPREADIQRALACGTPLGSGTNPKPGELQQHTVDTSVFPDALCNDGTPAVLYFRPHRGQANRDKWVISLRGGGSCGSAASCAARWCSCDSLHKCPYAQQTTNFNLNNMSGGGAASLEGGGIMRRDPPPATPNPVEDYNQAQLIYCSSDAWGGNTRGLTFHTVHPRTGEEVAYTLHFLGARILEADLSTLRQEGVPALVYQLGAAPTTMPDLDDATEVVLVGDSAGGAGVITHLDSVTTLLRTHHHGCDGGASCPPQVLGVIDAIVGPDYSRLDWSQAVGADAGVDSYEKAMQRVGQSPIQQQSHNDESCVAFHRQKGDGSEWRCHDQTHVIRHHVTTPMFVRMALLDSLISSGYSELGLSDPQQGPFTPSVFAKVLQFELSQFPQLPSSAEEGAAMSRAPGVFAPACAKHDTLHSNPDTYETTITPSGGSPTRFFEVFEAWRQGSSPSALLTMDPTRQDTVCP